MRSLLVLLFVVCTACGGTAHVKQSEQARPSEPAKEQVTYVALGDSYTAAPYVVETDVADGCLRSSHNYPHLLADEIGAKLTDVSCGSATTANITGPQRTFGNATVPAQLHAVPSDADLVTLGIGGNDGGVYRSMIAGCPITGPQGEQFPSSGRCGAISRGSLDSTFATTQRHIVKTIRTIQTRAPKAVVVLVGYPRLLGSKGCAALPIAASDADGARKVAQQLRDVQKRAAAATKIAFVDMHEQSAGHDACAADPWVRGIHADARKGAAMHPTPEGQKAVAKAIAQVWSDSSR